MKGVTRGKLGVRQETKNGKPMFTGRSGRAHKGDRRSKEYKEENGEWRGRKGSRRDWSASLTERHRCPRFIKAEAEAGRGKMNFPR